MKIFQKKGTCAGIIIAVALLLALLAELCGFVYKTDLKVSGNKASVLGAPNMSSYGYSVGQDGKYSPTTPDPQIYILDTGIGVRSIAVTLKDRILMPIEYQVFYATDGGFTEGKSVKGTISTGAKYFTVSIPDGDFDDLRLDINGTVKFSDIVVTDGTVTAEKIAVRSFSFLRMMAAFIALLVFGFLALRWYLSDNPRKLTAWEILFLGAIFCFYCLWAVTKGFNYAPDEAMRYDVTWFLFENNRLPVYDELLSDWGFSYAHLPAVLCSQLGYVLMKITSVFTTNPTVLLMAARMVSVLSCVGAVYFIIKLTKLILKTPARWIMIVTVAFMPQFAFISSYVNNDSVAFLGVSIIAYSWALGITDNWNVKNCILLSVGIATCALSYYNSYAWILLSVAFFIFSYLYMNKKDYKGLFKYAGIVVGCTFLLAGYCFIRHLVVYGDLLGFETSHYYGELYSIPSLHPDNRLSIAEQGLSLGDMLFDKHWLSTSFKSFIGVFGYMQYSCPPVVYSLAKLFITVAIIGCLIGGAVRIIKKKWPERLKFAFYIAVALCAVITVALSIYNSYNTDFQPQGRYCYPAFLSIALFIAIGYDSILKLFKNENHRYALTAILCTAFIGISAFVFLKVYLPS